MTRGYFGIGIYHTKTAANVGTLWRSASLYGAAFVFTIGRRYQKQCSDTMQTPRHTPLYHFADADDFYAHLPYDARLIAVELTDNAHALPNFCHPERAVYLLGAEDSGLPKDLLEKAWATVQIPTMMPQSMNVATAGTVVMYDRFVKGVAL